MTGNTLSRGLTRRQFVKTAAAAAAAVAVGDKLLGGRNNALVANAAGANAPKQDSWHTGVCFMCTQSDCITQVHVVDGVVIKVEGNPKSITNKGTLCPRGNSAIMTLYNPWRVKAPMKRTNPTKSLTADPKWVEITWDEALNTIADRLKKVKADDPRKAVFIDGFGTRSNSEKSAFISAFGSPNTIRVGGAACAYHFGCAYVHGQHPEAIMDMDRVEWMMNIGRNIGPNHGTASSGTKIMLDAIDRGAKIVNVDPHCGPEQSKSTEWIPIKPATDLAFMLGMLNTALYEIKIMDEWSVKNRSNAPYLIGPDGNYVRDATSKKPLMWDAVAKKASAFDEMPSMNAALEGTFDVNGVKASPAFQLIKDAMKPYTPEWAEKQCTVPAATIRRLTQEFFDHAKIGSTITIDGFVFPFRPAGINLQRGAYAHNTEGVFADLVTKIMMELIGGFDVPGGMSGNKMPDKTILSPDKDGVVEPKGEPSGSGREWKWPPSIIDSRQFYPVGHTHFSMGAMAILNPKEYFIPYETEILVHIGGNPFSGHFNRAKFEQIFAKPPFNISFPLTFDGPTQFADVLLPDDSFMERPWHRTSAQPHKVKDATTLGSTLWYWRDVTKITKPYNTRNLSDVMQDLSKRMGILTGKGNFVDRMVGSLAGTKYAFDIEKDYNPRDLAERSLKAAFGDQYTLDAITVDTPPPTRFDVTGAKQHNYYYWPDNKTRHPMYMMQLKVMGEQLKANMKAAGLTRVPGWKQEDMEFFWKSYSPIITWVPAPQNTAPAGYDLWVTPYKSQHSAFYVGDAPGNIWLNEAFKTFDPYEYSVLMNSATAAKKGLKDGDIVIVESLYGKTEGKLKTTGLMHTEALGFGGYHGFDNGPLESPTVADGPNYNVLCSSDESNLGVDPITAGIEQGPAVKVYRKA
jgi:anaerobic selenocysteine-containing dehydrogenase